ncbi:hypothetical protein AgCh_039672 [Apium graveolens]
MDSTNQVAAASPAITTETFTGTLGRHLARRLVQIGVKDVFSVPTYRVLRIASVKAGDITSKTKNEVMYRPIKDLKGIPGAKSLVVCLNGYQRQYRDDIMIWSYYYD